MSTRTHRLGQAGISGFAIECAQVVDIEFRVEARDEQLVHVDVLAVKLYAADLQCMYHFEKSNEIIWTLSNIRRLAGASPSAARVSAGQIA